MKTIIALLACAVILVAVIGVSRYQDQQFRQSPGGIAIADRLKAEADARDEIGKRVDRLSRDGCGTPVVAILAQHRRERITSRANISAPLLADLDLCLERGIMRRYVHDELKDAGILKLL